MGLRPSKCYRDVKNPAYTRFSKRLPKKSYIKGIPGSKVVMYDMGNKTGSFDTEISLITAERKQLRHNALEAARVATNKYLTKQLGKLGYRLKIRVWTHHIMRENPIASGAGADRFQTGMKKSFGKPIGRTARVKANQKVMTVYTNEENLVAAKEALYRAKMKLPSRYLILVEKVVTPHA